MQMHIYSKRLPASHNKKVKLYISGQDVHSDGLCKSAVSYNYGLNIFGFLTALLEKTRQPDMLWNKLVNQ